MRLGVGVRVPQAAVFAAALSATMVVCALWAGTAAAVNGSLVICTTGGSSGQTYTFSITKGLYKTIDPAFQVPGGGCGAPLSVVAGNYTIIEDLSSGQFTLQSFAVSGGTKLGGN